jgi:alkyl hydroperoxide reductase subunit AhpC
MRLGIILVTALILSLATTAFGQRNLNVGDDAPGLDVEQWIKGPETSIAGQQVYLIHFWETTSRACQRAIPLFSDLQEEFGDRDLTVVGITSEEVDVVEPWVRNQGSKMEYIVAVDRRNSTTNAWVQAAGVTARPAVFIVDRAGKIAFIGVIDLNDDGQRMASVLVKVLEGRYDPRLEREAEPRLTAARGARKTRTWRMAFKHYDDVIELSHTVFAEIALERFDMMLVDMEDREEAYKYAREKLMGEFFASDPGALAMLAEKIATDPKLDKEDRDLDVALEAAQTAMNLASQREPEAYATLAMVHYHRGELDQAIKLQKKAYFIAKPKRKPRYKRVLEAYQGAAGRLAGNSE